MFTVIQVLGLLKGKGEKVEVTENDEKKRKVTVEIETDSEEEKEEEMKPEKNENILVMMDSHSQSLDNSKLAAAFPTSIFSYFKASNSTSSWPGARFPESSHSARVPALLARRRYDVLVLLCPCNDLSNTAYTAYTNTAYQFHLAKVSSLNMVKLAEDALAMFPSLSKVVLLPRPPRMDCTHLANLTYYSNSVMTQAVAISPVKRKLRVGCTVPCNTEEDKVKLFGRKSSSKFDGIHLTGNSAKEIFTESH